MNFADKYRIVERTGDQKRRKFNEVFIVESKVTGEKAILKTLSKTTDNFHLQQRLKSEASFEFNLDGLPRTLDLFETDHELFLVRSFQPGIPLNAFIKEVKQKDKPGFILQLLNGLTPIFTELEKQQVVHLDIKPSNILIDRQPDGFRVSLIDFGLSLRLNEEVNRKTLFPLGYAAPELLLNRLHLADHRTDQFALGVVIWQCFTGNLPLLNPHPGIMTNLQLTHPLPEHDEIRKKYFRVLERMCHKYVFSKPPNQLPAEEQDRLLKSALEQRYASFDEVIQDWETALQKRWYF